MNLLAIDTVTEHCSVALGTGDAVYQDIETGSKIHSRMVLDMVEGLLRDHSIELNDLDCIAVDTGPGSFTGVRIGVGVTQGLAYAMQIPVLGINSLQVLAASCPQGKVLCAMDARMGQVYCGYYDVSENREPVELWAPMVVNPENINTDVEDQTMAAGNGWHVYRERLADKLTSKGVVLENKEYPQARHAISIARHLGLGSAQSPLLVQACYVRNNVTDNPLPPNTKR